MKRCKVCGVTKPLHEFYRAAGMRDGRRNDCIQCNLQRRKERYDSADAVARVQRWRKENPERYAAARRAYNARPERKRAMRDAYYRRTFGLSADEVDAMLAAQGGGCAICSEKPEREASMHVDHCHVTGRIRGLLCLNCNQGIGKFGEDPLRLQRAADYLAGSR